MDVCFGSNVDSGKVGSKNNTPGVVLSTLANLSVAGLVSRCALDDVVSKSSVLCLWCLVCVSMREFPHKPQYSRNQLLSAAAQLLSSLKELGLIPAGPPIEEVRRMEGVVKWS